MSIFPTDILYFVPEVKYNSLVRLNRILKVRRKKIIKNIYFPAWDCLIELRLNG